MIALSKSTDHLYNVSAFPISLLSVVIDQKLLLVVLDVMNRSMGLLDYSVVATIVMVVVCFHPMKKHIHQGLSCKSIALLLL